MSEPDREICLCWACGSKGRHKRSLRAPTIKITPWRTICDDCKDSFNNWRKRRKETRQPKPTPSAQQLSAAQQRAADDKLYPCVRCGSDDHNRNVCPNLGRPNDTLFR